MLLRRAPRVAEQESERGETGNEIGEIDFLSSLERFMSKTNAHAERGATRFAETLSWTYPSILETVVEVTVGGGLTYLRSLHHGYALFLFFSVDKQKNTCGCQGFAHVVDSHITHFSQPEDTTD